MSLPLIYVTILSMLVHDKDGFCDDLLQYIRGGDADELQTSFHCTGALHRNRYTWDMRDYSVIPLLVWTD